MKIREAIAPTAFALSLLAGCSSHESAPQSAPAKTTTTVGVEIGSAASIDHNPTAPVNELVGTDTCVALFGLNSALNQEKSGDSPEARAKIGEAVADARADLVATHGELIDSRAPEDLALTQPIIAALTAAERLDLQNPALDPTQLAQATQLAATATNNC